MQEEELEQLYSLYLSYLKSMPIWSQHNVEINRVGNLFKFSKNGFSISVDYAHINFIGVRSVFESITSLEA